MIHAGMPESAVSVRPAGPGDLTLVASFDVLASSEPFGSPFWQDLLPAGTDPSAFAEALFAEDASGWGAIPDFLVVEVNGEAAAGCSVFEPKDCPEDGPVRPDRLPAVGRRLGWSDATVAAVGEAYDRAWNGLHPALRVPQATAIVECVAVLPRFRGRGLGHVLMDAAKANARSRGHRTLGIQVVHGNDAAARLYATHFEPYATFHAACFDDGFPGVTKFRALL